MVQRLQPRIDELMTQLLNECYPGSRYIVADHSIAMAAEMTRTNLAPSLQEGPSRAGATARTNVFMNGVEGPVLAPVTFSA